MNHRVIPTYTDSASWVGMRNAGKIAAQVLDRIGACITAGVTTQYLNDLCHQWILECGAVPAPLEVGFPCAVCISVNEVICHGVPGEQILLSGDIVNIDVSLCYEGWYADTCRMFYVETPSLEAQQLSTLCYEAFMDAIALVKPGIPLGDIGHIIQTKTEAAGYSVVKDFCGHGIGRKLHCAPEVLHFGKKGTGLRLKEGMFFTIEPMINLGKAGARILQDGWTAVTQDGTLSAQWEHTLGVTATGCEIFTMSSILPSV